MRKAGLIVTIALVSLAAGDVAHAQTPTSGTVTVTGTTPEALSLTNESDATVSSTIALGTLTPGTSNTLTTGQTTIRLRSNKAYKVTAQAAPLSVTGPGSADGGSSIALSDIGFGIRSMVLTGQNVANSGSRTDQIAAGFDAKDWPAVTNGVTPAFTKTLADLSSATQVLSGSRVSTRGNIATDNNFITATFGVATLPQFFTPNSGFSSVVTLTIAAQ